ncbi:DedA family protein [Candidatus Gillettellia adelgis]
MEPYLEHLITQSLVVTLTVIVLINFLESLALVGLLLPGTLMMTSIGVLIGGGKIDFYYAWAASIVGCLLGDWISYCIGRLCKDSLYRWSFLKKHQVVLDRTEKALYQHSIATILISRFIGPMRPLVPIVAGMLNLPSHKFALPNSIGCITWPPIYFFPGILAGVAIDIPDNDNSGLFNWLLLIFFLLIWMSVWLTWRKWRKDKFYIDSLSEWLPPERLRMLCVLSWLAVLIVGYFMSQQKQILIYRHLLWQVLFG